MTKLPQKNLLDASKLPKTTTGEMKNALGDMRDYLHELLGEDSSDKESARRALGIDLTKLEAKADQEAVEELKEAIERKGIPVGTVAYFAMGEAPSGYLKADGSAVGRETYPELFFAIGTTYGEGDGETTFNLPDLMGRFAEGSATPGTVKAAGLPNITGTVGAGDTTWAYGGEAGAFSRIPFSGPSYRSTVTVGGNNAFGAYFNAAHAHPVYGASNTVQPAALTLLPCIKAFDTILPLDVSGLVKGRKATGKAASLIDDKPVVSVVDVYQDGVNWWRQWSDGWLEQGGRANATRSATGTLHHLNRAYADSCYTLTLSPLIAGAAPALYAVCELERSPASFRSQGVCGNADGFVYTELVFNWYSCGMGRP